MTLLGLLYATNMNVDNLSDYLRSERDCSPSDWAMWKSDWSEILVGKHDETWIILMRSVTSFSPNFMRTRLLNSTYDNMTINHDSSCCALFYGIVVTGKLFPRNMAFKPMVPTKELAICNWKGSTSTTTKPLLASMCLGQS